MISVTAAYLECRGEQIRSKNAAKRACKLVNDYLRMVVLDRAPLVNDFGLARQHAFMRWCRDEHGLSAKSITTYLSTIKAAISLASTPRIICDSKGVEREAKLLDVPFFIQASEQEVAKVTGLAPSQPRDFIPSDAQLAAFIDAIYDEHDESEKRDREHVFRYVIMALNLWGRPEALTELDVGQQVDFSRGLVDLNPRGRIQNKKRRPLVRLTDNLRGWLLHWNLSKPIVYNGAPVDEVLPQTFKKIARKAGAPEMVRYTLRHYMNTRTMRVPADIRPDREERAIWMGHSDPRHKTTQAYEHLDPDYLSRCAAATDAIMTTLNKLCARSLFAPNAVPGSRLTVIEGNVSNAVVTRGGK